MKICPWAKKLMITSSDTLQLDSKYAIGHEMLLLKQSKDVIKKQGKKENEMFKDKWNVF